MNYKERYDTFKRLKKHYKEMGNTNSKTQELKTDKELLIKLTDWMVTHLDRFTDKLFEIEMHNGMFSYELKYIEDASTLSDDDRTIMQSVRKWHELTVKYKECSWYEKEIEMDHIKNCGLFLWPNTVYSPPRIAFTVSIGSSTFDTYNSVFVKDYFDWKTFFEKIKHFFKR